MTFRLFQISYNVIYPATQLRKVFILIMYFSLNVTNITVFLKQLCSAIRRHVMLLALGLSIFIELERRCEDEMFFNKIRTFLQEL